MREETFKIHCDSKPHGIAYVCIVCVYDCVCTCEREREYVCEYAYAYMYVCACLCMCTHVCVWGSCVHPLDYSLEHVKNGFLKARLVDSIYINLTSHSIT